MMHGPCGAYASDSSCMDKGVCTKGFPRSYCESTFISPQGWPHYARPNDGREANVGSRNIMLFHITGIFWLNTTVTLMLNGVIKDHL